MHLQLLLVCIGIMEEQKKENLSDVGEFISEYCIHMIGCGVHTSRVIRSAKRIGISFGYEVRISAFQRNIILTLMDKETQEHYNDVLDIPALPISFEHNAKLSALSWETYDKHLSLDTLWKKYHHILERPTVHPFFVLMMVGFANAAFCRLFGGDWLSMGIVFSATVCGFFLKQQMVKAGISNYLVFIVAAFVASLCASTSLIFDTTSDIALATSVLFLIPGVPMINGIIDIIEGHVLNGITRLIQALLLIVCVATGLSFTLLLVKNSLL